MIHFTTNPITLLTVSTDKSVSDNNGNCEAYGCNNEATYQVTVRVGRRGNIELNLCESCTPEFKEQKERSVSAQDTNRRTHNPRAMSLTNGNKRRSSR